MIPGRGLSVERPERSLKSKKPSDSSKTENEGINESRRKHFAGLASSFSLTEKLAAPSDG
jgi:hypothetical protein